MDDMLPVWPSAYPAAMTYDFFTYAGAPGAYNLALGAGAGVYWKSDDFSISTSYLSINGNDSNPNTGGIGTDGAGFSATTQIAYAPENWGIAAAYTKASSENGVGLYIGNANLEAAALSYLGEQTNSVGLSAWWMPEESGWIPSVSVGYGGTWIDNSDDDYTNSWYVGLQWDDAFIEGNSLGMAVGQPTFRHRWRRCRLRLGILLQVPGHRQHQRHSCHHLPEQAFPFSGLRRHERHERSDQDPVQVLILGLRSLLGFHPLQMLQLPTSVGSFFLINYARKIVMLIPQ